jgi:hypothetical protein
VAVSFGAAAPAGGPAVAWIAHEDARVDVTLTGPDAVVIEAGGIGLDGDGALTADEAAALAALFEGPAGRGAALLPLELGCASVDVAPAGLAALLAPLQARFKYAVTDREAEARALADALGCAWFAVPGDDLTGLRVPGPALRLSTEGVVPDVFGWLPFDDQGEIEDLRRAAGDPTGPCGALCRGACGPNCIWTSCEQTRKDTVCLLTAFGLNSGLAYVEAEVSCGSAQGCREHDDCYDTCHTAFACGSWDSAFCRRGCDEEACAAWGVDNCAQWALGGGPKDYNLDFVFGLQHHAPVPAPDECPTPIPNPQIALNSATDMSFDEALAYCEALIEAGLNDWVLPSQVTLGALVEGCDAPPCASGGGPGSGGCYWSDGVFAPCGIYWSDAPVPPGLPEDPPRAWALDFTKGDWVDRPIGSPAGALCVREQW